jgi:pimeloyl-ACP methyl ester carboxylesterase
MDARDISAIGDVLAETFDGTTRRVEEVHQAVARRSFAAAGPARSVPEAIHDRIAARLYAALRTVGPAAIRSSALGLGTAVGPEAGRLHRSGRGKAVVSAFNGVFGDALARRRNGLALPMAIKHDGVVVRPTAKSLARAFPDAGARIAVFVHGFGETDDSWRWWSEAHWGAPNVSYGQLLRRDRGYTPLYVHYNSGRKIADNAAELSALLAAVAANWPVPLTEIVLVGHSAGGVVAREAVRAGIRHSEPWAAITADVVSLGVPRTAIAAETAVGAARRMLAKLPESEPLARLLDARSAGLKDLRECDEEPLPEGISDLRLPRRALKINHFKLLNHPLVYEQLKAGLSDRSAPGQAPAARGERYARAARALRSPKRSRRRSRSRSR